jgi:hypothetical protein
MSEEQDRMRSLAQRIAQRLEEKETESSRSNVSSGEFSDLRAMLADMNKRLVQIESHLARKEVSVAPTAKQGSFSNWSNVATMKEHPSLDKFKVDEATAISEMVDFFESEKKCSLDPSGKPCDHCSMCSSRGF